jgi:hypothetical protein
MGLFFFKKIEDNGTASLTHLLLRDFEECCFFASASGTGCWLVVADRSSRYSKTGNLAERYVFILYAVMFT